MKSFKYNMIPKHYKLYILIVTALLFNSLCHSQESNKTSIIKKTEWITETVEYLKNYHPSDQESGIKLKSLNKEGASYLSYRLVNKGLIRFNEDDWVFIITHSNHSNDSIGDITIAIDQDGVIFSHYGHVCGGIVHYETSSLKECLRSKDFFAFFVDDSEKREWIKLEGKQN